MKTAYVVLGMHRSGTSSVAGVLALLGATPPLTLMSPKPENPKGFWESEVIMALNDRILAACASAWDDASALDLSRLDPATRRGFGASAIEALDREFGGAEVIVLKDPRLCRFYGFWQEVLDHAGYAPLVVSPIRSPMEVAASLSARNPVSREQGLRLWLRHVLDAEAASRGRPRHLMAWDDFMGDWRTQIATMSARLDRPLDAAAGRADEIATFLSPDLRHHRMDSVKVPVPALLETVHAALLDIARHGESEAAHRRLHQAQAVFDDPSGTL